MNEFMLCNDPGTRRLPYGWPALVTFVLTLSAIRASVSHALPQDANVTPHWLEAATPDETAPDAIVPAGLWARRVISLEPVPADGCFMNVAAVGVTSVYFNGQRVLRNERLRFQDTSPAALAIDVTPLLRNGSNCIAVSVTAPGEKQVARAAVWLADASGRIIAATDKQWNVSDAAPPVGWQQTDSNDRPNDRGLTSSWNAAVPATVLDVSAIPPASLTPRPWKLRQTTTRPLSEPFRFDDGDHVVLLGATFIERAQRFGHLEAVLTASAGDRHVTFRNLGWSADTVLAESRGIFDSPDVGYLRMIEHVRAEEPTVIFVSYGQNEAMQWGSTTDARQRFEIQLGRLLDDLSTTQADIVLISPHAFLPTPAPLPDPRHWNDSLEQYTRLLQRIGAERSLRFVDLMTDMQSKLMQIDDALQPGRTTSQLDDAEHPELTAGRLSQWTDNGMHFNESGYSRIALLLAEGLLNNAPQPEPISVDPANEVVECADGEVQDVQWSPAGGESVLVKFRFRRHKLSACPIVVRLSSIGSDSVVQYAVQLTAPNGETRQLEQKRATLSIRQDTGHTQQFLGTDVQYETLRQLIVKKNELYFHRWRPQNITYLFGFRKHEQGNNASEIALFDPLIDELERQIHAAQEPQWQAVTVQAGK